MSPKNAKGTKQLKNPLPDEDFRKALVMVFAQYKAVSKDYSVINTTRLRKRISRMKINNTPDPNAAADMRFIPHKGKAGMQVELRRVPFVLPSGSCECIEYCLPDFECCRLMC